MLAEISDKMPTITVLWLWGLALSVPLLAGIVRKWMSAVGLWVGSVLSLGLVRSAYHQAFLEGAFSEDIYREMGRAWIAHSVLSAFLPAVIALAVFCWHLRKHRRLPYAPEICHSGPTT
jgi:hypothetical protein